ncbi:sugar MFS transporter [Thalassotalea maritima]|uniref:sugar MFS transporter n=1 Tax=Thalassotalea maritima TaxID=3242416 RepID=UPI003527E8E9
MNDFNNINKSNKLSVAIIGLLFFIFGFVTWLNGALIPFLQTACELSHHEAYLVTMTFYIAYTVAALPSSAILKKVGYKNGMVMGLCIMAIGSLIFIPAAVERMYPLFLTALFVLGAGLTILQTAANPYIVLLGPQESAAARISIMGLMNKGAGILAPIVFSVLLFSDIAMFSEENMSLLSASDKALQLQELSMRLIQPYIVMASILFVLSLFVYKSPLPEIGKITDERDDRLDIKATLRFPQLTLGVITLFLYVGVEVIAGDTIGLFGKEMGVINYATLTSYTMFFMVIAYILGMVCIPRFIKQETALLASAICGLALTFMIIFSPSETYYISNAILSFMLNERIPDVVLYVTMLGFANALVWPALWPMALNGLGKYMSTGSALLIMGISGGAILPFVYGLTSDFTGDVQSSYVVMLPCYAFILFYAYKGHKISSWSSPKLHPSIINQSK